YWLEKNGYLKPLFEPGELDECSFLIMDWLVNNFTIEQPDIIFELISVQGIRLNARFWEKIIRKVSLDEERTPEASALK
ncbi:hypothetical protein ACXWP3_09750, partial [Streptococcus pyogenes]